MFFASVYLGALEWRFHFRSDSARGTVRSKWVSMASKVRSYNVRYEYRTAEGDAFEDTDAVGRSYWETLQPGASVRVIYLPRQPSHSRLVRDWRLGFPLGLLLVGGCCGAMGSTVLFLEGLGLETKADRRRRR